MADVNGHIPGYPGLTAASLNLGAPRRVWFALDPTTAASYELDELGYWNLTAVLIAGPTSERLRGFPLRAHERLAPGVWENGLAQDTPPPVENLPELHSMQAFAAKADAAAQVAAKALAGIRTARREAVDAACAPEQLARRSGEPADAFYARIAVAHAALSRVTDRPTTELARRAGVVKGTAAGWVSKARARGVYPSATTTEGEQ